MAVRDEDVIDNVVVRVSPDLTGFMAKLRTLIREEQRKPKQPVYKVKVVADGAGLKASVKKAVDQQMLLTKQPTYKVKVVADGVGLVASAREEVKKQQLLGKQPVYKVKMVADGKGFAGRSGQSDIERLIDRNKLAQERADRDRVRSAERAERDRVRAAERAARDQVRAAERAAREEQRILKERTRAFNKARRGPQLIDTGAEGFRPLNLLYGAVAALTPALLAMSSSAVQAATSVAALGSAGIGAATALGGLLVAFSPIVSALKLSQTVDIAKTVRGQKNALKAQQRANKVSGAKDIALTAEERAKALRDVAAAQRDVVAATRDERTAYAAIHTARREAIRDLEDLRRSVRDLDNQYSSDRLSVAEAAQQERNTNANFFASALDRARAHQDTLDARTRLADTALERKQKRQDLARSLKTGIEGSDTVLQARERARDARNRRLDAQDRLANARAELVKKKAAQAASSVSDVGAAVSDLTNPAEKLNQLIADMSPSAQKLYQFLYKNQQVFKDLRKTIQEGVTPGFLKFLKAITLPPKGGGKSTLQIVADDAARLGSVLGKYAAEFGAFTQTPLFRSNMATIQKNNAVAFDKLGRALHIALSPLLKILSASSPLLVKFGDKLIDLAKKFSDFIDRSDLTLWFEDTAEEAGKWYDIVSNLLGVVRGIFTASLPAGQGLVGAFRDFTSDLQEWANSENGQSQLRSFFTTIKDLPYARIRDMLLQFSTLFIQYKAINWAITNPFFAALGILATSNPGAATSLIQTISTMFQTVSKTIAAHPEMTATLLTILSIAKLNKAGGGILFKVAGVDKLKELLSSKSKLFGDLLGSKTATMHVTAGVVNVYGAAGAGGLIPGAAGRAGAAGRVAGGAAGAGGLAAVGSAPVTIAVVGAVLGAIFSKQQFQRAGRGEGFLDPFKQFAQNPSVDTALNTAQFTSPIGWAAFALGQPEVKGFFKKEIPGLIKVGLETVFPGIGSVADALNRKLGITTPGNVLAAQGQESIAFKGLKNKLSSFGAESSITKEGLDQYIIKRKQAVKAYVDWVRGKDGPEAAAKAQQEQDEASVRTLQKVLMQMGFNKTKAEGFARTVYNVGVEQMYADEKARNAAKSFDSMGNALDTAKKKAQNTNGAVDKLNDTIKATFGPHVMALSTKNYKEVKRQLDMLYAIQHVLYNPVYSNSTKGADTISSQNQFLDPVTGKPVPIAQLGQKRAQGGHIRGRGTETSDSIPAWLSHNEYVLPAKAVRYYGVEQLDAMRERKMPRYAAGGSVTDPNRNAGMPFIANLPLRGPKLNITDLSGPYGGDVPYTGKVPKGLGDVVGLTGQMMSAIIDLKAHYPQAYVTSGLRHTRVASGQKSNHWFGRAADIIPPSMAAFDYLASKYGTVAREIIYSPANARQIWHGKPHMYSSDVRAAHFNHIHLALKDGGLVPRSFDRGGTLPPGYTLAFNGTGKNETVRTKQQDQNAQGPVRIDRRDLALLASAMSTGGTTVTMDGRRVAELTNKYNYLPAGV